MTYLCHPECEFLNAALPAPGETKEQETNKAQYHSKAMPDFCDYKIMATIRQGGGHCLNKMMLKQTEKPLNDKLYRTIKLCVNSQNIKFKFIIMVPYPLVPPIL